MSEERYMGESVMNAEKERRSIERHRHINGFVV